MRSGARGWLGAFLLAALAIPANAASDALTGARALAAENKWAEVAARLEEHLRFELSDPAIDDLLGQALAKLGRADEAAFYFDRALAVLPETDKEAPRIRKRLTEVDPLATKRDAALKKSVKSLFESAKALHAGGHVERSLSMLERLRPIARGAELAEITALAESIRATTEKVDLDKAGGSERPDGGWPALAIESQRYKLNAKLESAVAEKLGKTMDEIFEYYVKIYFDGDRSRVDPRKATIFIHSSHSDMGKSWRGGGPTPGGWWSPGEWQVHAYDTREESGTLDGMLLTLFHEASHQFMTMLAGGGATPAWLNEGTASFFEGATAMADGRVLWPDAATERLASLNAMLNGQRFAGPTPSFLDVISFNEPGSYPPEYYPWGWGLVYFLQQYEDPQSLEYSYRSKYVEYRDEVIKRRTDPREAFEKIFVGPGKHATLAAFETEWRRWVQQSVHPLHFGARRRELRMEEVQRYMAAAKKAAAGSKQAKSAETELLLRALGHVEYVRSRIDGPDAPDPQLLLLQADILERVGRAASAAPLLEQLIELAGDGTWEVSDDELGKLEKRLSKLDSKNSALRTANSRAKTLGRQALELVDAYGQAKTPLLLRSYTLASALAAALDDSGPLRERSKELRAAAREAGLLKGATYKLGGSAGAWRTIFTNRETTFRAAPGRIEIEGVTPVGRLYTATPISGEYEVRARLTRTGEVKLGSHHGLVVSGTPNGDWLTITIDFENKLWLKRMRLGTGGGVSDTPVSHLIMFQPPAPDKAFELTAHVVPDGTIEVFVDGDGPYPFEAPLALPAIAHVGVYVKNGGLLVEDAVIEILP